MNFSDLDVSKLLEIADCSISMSAIEMAGKETISRDLSKLKRHDESVASAVDGDSLHKVITDAPKWLPFAAEKYLLSPDIKDYVLVPVIILPSDLPNRNKVAFPFTELTSFNPEAGMLSYQTWKGKPTYVEHVNRDYTKAKGVIFDASLQRMPHRMGNLWKLVSLCGFDRTKDPILANNIQEGVEVNYSMGALVTRYTCSVCGAEGHNKESLGCGSAHVTPKGPFKLHTAKSGMRLGHYNAHNITGFEVSSVKVPAWPSASASVDQHLSW